MPCLGRTQMPSSCSRNGHDRPTQHTPFLSKVVTCNNVLCGGSLTWPWKRTKTYASYETTFCECNAKICTVWEKEWHTPLTSKIQGTGILLSNTHGAPKTATRATKTFISVFSHLSGFSSDSSSSQSSLPTTWTSFCSAELVAGQRSWLFGDFVCLFCTVFFFQFDTG